MKDERVYLIHFEIPFKHAKHYVGYASNLQRRIERHRRGAGSRLLYHVQNAGIRWYVVRTWNAPKSFESKLKKWRSNTGFCPVCSQNRDLISTARKWPICNAQPLDSFNAQVARVLKADIPL